MTALGAQVSVAQPTIEDLVDALAELQEIGAPDDARVKWWWDKEEGLWKFRASWEDGKAPHTMTCAVYGQPMTMPFTEREATCDCGRP